MWYHRIKKCIDYAHKSFDYENAIRTMQDYLNDDICDDDSNIQDPNVLANITNVKDELQNSFQQIKFFAVSYKHIQLTKTNIGIFFYRRFSCPDHTPADQE